MTTRNPADLYLKVVGKLWYVSVRVPPSLAQKVGNTHIRRSLQTHDKAEARVRKHAVVAEIKQQLHAMKMGQVSRFGKTALLNFVDPTQVRKAIQQAHAERDETGIEVLTDLAAEAAEELEQTAGVETAQRYFRAATNSADTIKETQAKYLAASDFKESTNAAHRLALAEVLAYLKTDDVMPRDVTRAVAVKYFDEVLTKRGLSYSTITDRLSSLGSFWKWMEGRGTVAANANPWTGHKVSKKAHASKTPPKRPYTDSELIKLLQACPEVARWPTLGTIQDVLILGMYTGARLEEICSLDTARVELGESFAILTVPYAKTPAGIRSTAVVHPAPVAVIKRRLEAANGGRLFPELSEGGLDDKFSASLSKAYGRYRRACGVPDGTDAHSLRRSCITMLEHNDADNRAIARFVGHQVGTLAADVYSGSHSRAQLLAAASKVVYPEAVQTAALTLAKP